MSSKNLTLTYEVFRKIRKDCTSGMSVKALSQKFTLPVECITQVLTAPSFEKASEGFAKAMSRPAQNKAAPEISKRDYQILDMRRNGLTLDEIGKKCGLTRERVRQIISKHGKNIVFTTPSEARAIARTKELKAISIEITANWKIYRSYTIARLAQEYNLNERDILKCINKVQHAYLRSNQESHIEQIWTKETCIKVLRDAATYAFPLTVLEYRKLVKSKTIEGPTLPIFISRFGSWMEACRAAGVETGNPVREYDTNWSDTDLLLMVRRFMWETRDEGWSIDSYTKWRNRQDPIVASTGILRLRLGQWSDLRVLALDFDAPEFDMSIFDELEIHEE